ncbi:MAG: hypothetical protein M3527_02570 [Actinomycetota bacterium]|nr:hypothetical protein [Acidimicrobiia bacterium]MDQ3293325.1 hypothetical protein [Actinomycetota bacterium]
MKSVDQGKLSDLIAQTTPRGRTSKGGELIEEFIGGGDVAATVELGSTKERNAIAISAANHARRAGSQIWVRKLGGGTGTELLLVNLAKADAATRKAYETRPRPGRRPTKR